MIGNKHDNGSTNIIVLGVLFVISIFVFGMWVSAINGEKTRYNMIEQMSENRENIFDSMWKQIKQVSQVSEKEKDGMKELIQSFMAGRGTIHGEKSFMSMLHENYPTIPELSYSKITNIITGKREEFQRYQTELKDRCRDYKDFTQTIPNSLFVNARDITGLCKIISSSVAQDVMSTHQENDINVF